MRSYFAKVVIGKTIASSNLASSANYKLMERRYILVNQIRTPDGTIIKSRHQHDYVTHIDKNGLEYMVDGGSTYLRRNYHPGFPFEELTVYVDSPFEEIRKSLERGGRGKYGKEPLKYVALKDINDKWLRNIIVYERRYRPYNSLLKLYEFEVLYRIHEEIEIPERISLKDRIKNVFRYLFR